MKKKLAVILSAAMMLSLAACGPAGASAGTASAESKTAETASVETASAETTSVETASASAESEEVMESTDSTSADSESAGAIHHAEIVIKEYGTITLELDGDAAPITVDNFISLAEDGFYDGLTFHRIIDGFMIQGGDPLGNGTGGSDQTIKGEFAENGVDNPISHEAGVISMARSQDPDSASSQFFITVADASFLDGQYAAFGHVTDGMDVAVQIAKDAEPVDGNGTIPLEAQPVIETIRIVD